MSSIKKSGLLGVMLLSHIMLSMTIRAQEGHYWSQQYGTRSMLLSGSVIGGVSDLGLVYYNPARLSQVKNPAFLISADVYEWNNLRITDAFGRDADATQSDFGGVPTLAAGTFKVPFLGNHHFAWAILQRTNMKLAPGYSKEVFEDVIEAFPGEEYFAADVSLDVGIKEQWSGVTWSYPLNNRVSIGLSGFYSHIDLKKGAKINMRAMTEDSQVALYQFDKSIGGSYDGLLFKAGLSYLLENGVIGFTVLTPTIKLRYSGAFRHNLFFANIEDYSPNEDIYLSTSQKDLKGKLHTPWAVGAGISNQWNNLTLHVSAEWYSGVKHYPVMTAAEYYSQSRGDTLNFSMVNKLKSVVNVGAGLEWYLNEHLSAYLSFSTDFTAIPENDYRFFDTEGTVIASGFKSDVYHYGGGVVVSVRGADITLGATHAGSRLTMPRLFDFPEEGDDEIFDQDEVTTLRWDRWRFVLSFSMPFLKDVGEKVEEKLGF